MTLWQRSRQHAPRWFLQRSPRSGEDRLRLVPSRRPRLRPSPLHRRRSPPLPLCRRSRLPGPPALVRRPPALIGRPRRCRYLRMKRSTARRRPRPASRVRWSQRHPSQKLPPPLPVGPPVPQRSVRRRCVHCRWHPPHSRILRLRQYWRRSRPLPRRVLLLTRSLPDRSPLRHHCSRLMRGPNPPLPQLRVIRRKLQQHHPVLPMQQLRQFRQRQHRRQRSHRRLR